MVGALSPPRGPSVPTLSLSSAGSGGASACAHAFGAQTHEREGGAHEERSESERAPRISQLLHPDVHVFVGAVDVAVVHEAAHELVAHPEEDVVHPVAARARHRVRADVVARAELALEEREDVAS